MVARPGTYQASNNAGELSPEEYGRTDLKQFYAGMALMRNVEPVPQGGSRVSMRTRHLARVRRKLVAATISAQDFAGGPHSGVAVIASVSLTEPQAISVMRFKSSASQILGAILQVEYMTPDGWVAFGPSIGMGRTLATYTAALPPGQSVTAKEWRFSLAVVPPSPTSFSALTLQPQIESAAIVPAARIKPFTFSLTQTYVAVLTDLHADFYRDGVYVGAAYTGVAESQLDIIDIQQRLDTMLLFHEDVTSTRIVRDAADTRWVSSDIPFDNIPRVDLGNAYVNQITDVWNIYLRFLTTGTYAGGKNLIVTVIINGEQSAGVSTGPVPDWSLFEIALQAAIEGMAAVEAGVTVTIDASAAGSGSVSVAISFGGTNNGSVFALAAQVVNTIDAAATAAHTTIGKAGGEALISAARGWAACATFYQDRLVIGGFRSKRSAFEASVTSEYFDLNVELVGASGAILANIDTDGAERLQRLVRGKHLMMFTSDAEYFVSDRVLSRNAPPTIVNSSRNGSASDLPVVESEGEIIYASRNKSVLYAASYDEVAQAYVSSPISLLAAHIVTAMTDIALQRPSTATNAARLWMPRADGTVVLGIMLRNQEVTAFVRWETPGLVRRVCVDGKNVPHLLVQRSVGASQDLHLERAEDGLIFDGVVEQSFGSPRTVIDGLAMHEGAQVWADADGYVSGPYTVAAGAIILPDAGSLVRVGRWRPPLARTLPLPSEVAERVVLKRPKRVHTVRLDLMNTTSVAVGANNRPAREVALARAGGPVDAPLLPVSRTEVITGLTGFSDTGQIDITQTTPGLLAWRGITIEARG